MELNHIFISAKKGAPEGDVLVDFGLVEGSPNTHPGQGTANRRFFFYNMMIELIWIEDYSEVQNERTSPLQLFERLSDTNTTVSPFGICFRPGSNGEVSAPFPAFKYKPSYLPDFLSIEVGDQTPLNEPMWFFVSFGSRPDCFPREKIDPMNHKIPLKEVTAAVISINKGVTLSKSAEIIKNLPNLELKEALENLLELEFDNGIEGKIHDFRPMLPLVFRW